MVAHTVAMLQVPHEIAGPLVKYTHQSIVTPTDDPGALQRGRDLKGNIKTDGMSKGLGLLKG